MQYKKYESLTNELTNKPWKDTPSCPHTDQTMWFLQNQYSSSTVIFAFPMSLLIINTGILILLKSLFLSQIVHFYTLIELEYFPSGTSLLWFLSSADCDDFIIIRLRTNHYPRSFRVNRFKVAANVRIRNFSWLQFLSVTLNETQKECDLLHFMV